MSNKNTILILSNTPRFLIERLPTRRNIQQWIYFGKKQSVMNTLNEIFNHQATSIDYGRELYFVSREKRNQFINWIDDVSVNRNFQREWFYSVPAVKNTASSNIFLFICYFFVLNHLIEKKQKVDLIVVDSPALSFVLKDHFRAQIRFPLFNYFQMMLFYFRVFLVSIFRYARFFWEASKKFFAVKRILAGRIKSFLKGNRRIVIIRNFIGPDFTSKEPGNFERHFFPGLNDFLKEECDYVPVFLPIILKCPSYQKLFSNVIKSNQMIVFAEEFLRLVDYIYTMFAWTRALQAKISIPFWDGFAFHLLVKEEYYSNITEDSYLNAHLLCKLGELFKKHRFHPGGIINWNENQAAEKALVSGFKEAFQDMIVIGSQPFVYSPNHLLITLSRQDELVGIVPDKTLVLGPIGREAAREFIPHLNIEYSPAFRYSRSLNNGRHGNIERHDAIVLLGYALPDAVSILRTLLEISAEMKLFNNVYIRLHPATYFNEERLIKELGQPLPSWYSFVIGELEDFLGTVCVGICAATGAAVNLVISGIPVIIIADGRSLTMNYLSYKEDPCMWRLCFTQQEAAEALQDFRRPSLQNHQTLQDKAKEFREAYFAETDAKYWRNYLITPPTEAAKYSIKEYK